MPYRSISLIVALVVVSVIPPAAARPRTTSVNDLSWLAGSWTSQDNGAETDEHWSTPLGGTILGMSRQLEGGKTVFTEFMFMEETDDGVFYTNKPTGLKEVRYKLIQCVGQRAVFENPRETWPRRFTYRKNRDGSLFIRLDGRKTGKPKVLEFTLVPRRS